VTTRYTADAVVLAPSDDRLHVLLVRRAADHDTEPGKLALPGGHVEPGETARDASARELFEETGLPLTTAEIKRLELVGVFDRPGRDPRGWYVSAAYMVVLSTLVDVKGGDDADHAEWVPVDEALAADLAFDHRDILTAALAVGGNAARERLNRRVLL
jgi:8-oxo-dGTP diphosphatase